MVWCCLFSFGTQDELYYPLRENFSMGSAKMSKTNERGSRLYVAIIFLG